MFRLPVAMACAGIMALGAPASALAARARMALSFTWAHTAACSRIPPAFALSGVPPGTKYLDFELVDLNAPGFHHGGGTVVYTGENTIPEGAFAYTGPCPPSGSHTYRWTIRALNASRREIGRAAATGMFPPK